MLVQLTLITFFQVFCLVSFTFFRQDSRVSWTCEDSSCRCRRRCRWSCERRALFSGAELSFPSINKDHVEAEENTAVILPFNISIFSNPENCLNKSFPIAVGRACNGNKTICSFHHYDNGTCRNTIHSKECKCGDPAGEWTHVLNRTVTREDNCTWIWTVAGGMIKQKEITIIVKYPPEVLKLNLSQVLNTTNAESLSSTSTSDILTVEEYSAVDVVCTWDAGNPPYNAILSHIHRDIESNTTRSSGQIRYRFAAVGCQDTGLIRCQAPGATRNQSATLLVRCPPHIQALSETNLTLTAGENMQLNTSVRAHVNNITNCILTRVDSNENIGCTRFNVTGSPPDLTVSVWWDNVRKRHQGTCRLTLTNDVGDGHLTFSVNVTGDDTGLSPSTTTSTTSEPNLNNGNLPTIVISVSLTFLTVAAVVSITMYLLCRQKYARKADEAHEGSKEYVMLRQESYDLASPSNDTMTNVGSGIPSDVVLPPNAADKGNNSAIRSIDSPYWEVADRMQRSAQQPGGGPTHRTVERDNAEIGADEKLTGRHQQQPPRPPSPQQKSQQQRQLAGDDGPLTSANASGSRSGGQQVARQVAPPGADNRASAERHDYKAIPNNLIVEHIPLGSGRGGQQMARQASPPCDDSAECHDYEENPDNLIVEHIPLVKVRPTRHCHAPHEAPLPDAYLHPSPSLPKRINTSYGASTSNHLQPTSDNAQATSDDTQCTWGTEWETISDNNQQIASDNTHPTLDYTQSTLVNTQSTKDNKQFTRKNTQSTSSITQSTSDYTGAMSVYTDATPDYTEAMSVYTKTVSNDTQPARVNTRTTSEYTQLTSDTILATSEYTQLPSDTILATSEYTQLTLDPTSATSEYTQLKWDI